ncbi:Uncharacterised protein (plasmid) [Tsukamurella tyrosinosolvens]|uniref:DUF2029 domain-containing protein n=1 Tax=Tsukamurella tyrosinosolvens TaxID=57704 RepID=A0A1H4I9M3_TSUTY|nr:hypothetical protein [Tsukamurella tyrosinosolvens]KXO98843.1 hypothetical protein AXK58_24560 [Tsukamurella tyrosinosolvens]SEB30058.1 hypothetical protein SAMN04489793_0074 [Tsukamurella tyrosinosolvens]VEH95716.1 Uncharacterised protein [Tsukamurella tyrosinosolvens]
MSAESRIEDFILAPSDPAWGDERNREEYYRAMSVGYYWAAPAALVGSLIAAAEGARITSMAVLLLLLATQLATYRYCSRHDVPLASITSAFLTPKRKAVMAAILIPYLAVWCALQLDRDPSTLAGAAVGGLLGAGIAAGAVFLAARTERRRDAAAAADDDVFE